MAGLDGIRLCSTCRHMRKRPAVTLFAGSGAQSAGVLKAQIEFDQERKQRAQLEFQRYLARQPFETEPHNYEWCARFTPIELVAAARRGDADALRTLMSEGGATMNPVSGEISPLYILCAWKNEDGRCPGHEPR